MPLGALEETMAVPPEEGREVQLSSGDMLALSAMKDARSSLMDMANTTMHQEELAMPGGGMEGVEGEEDEEDEDWGLVQEEHSHNLGLSLPSPSLQPSLAPGLNVALT